MTDQKPPKPTTGILSPGSSLPDGTRAIFVVKPGPNGETGLNIFDLNIMGTGGETPIIPLVNEGGKTTVKGNSRLIGTGTGSYGAVNKGGNLSIEDNARLEGDAAGLLNEAAPKNN